MKETTIVRPAAKRGQTRQTRPAPRLGLIMLVLAGLIASLAGAAHAEKKVTVCHLRAGDPAQAQTLSVGEGAVSGHLRHGDALGACPAGCVENPAACDDGNACTADACDPGGACPHDAVRCDDGNPCTTDLCDAGTGCLALADDGAACDDLNACTSADACVGGSCQGTATAGCCASCDDCGDQDPCTIDRCSDGSCANQPLDCTVADKCLAGFCTALGECATAPVRCDDSNVCTDDACDPISGCSHLPTANPPEAIEASCADAVDNDCDGFADAADSDCDRCGDGVMQAPEQCDGQDFGGESCQRLFPEGGGGPLVCTSSCQLDVSGCDTDGYD